MQDYEIGQIRNRQEPLPKQIKPVKIEIRT